MFKSLNRIFLVSLAFAIVLTGCTRPEKPAGSDEPVVIEQGSTVQPELLSPPSESSHNPDLAPIFPGAQKLNRGQESYDQRESYITNAPYELVEQYYLEFFKYGEVQPDEIPENETNVNTIVSRGADGMRQTALWVNPDDGPNGNLKVMLKEYGAQNTVQIILTNLDETPPGLNPIGMYLTPEELDAYLEEYHRQQAELEAQRQVIEGQAVDAPVVDDSSDDSENDGDEPDSGSDEGDE